MAMELLQLQSNTLTPVGLGSGCAGLDHKAASFVHPLVLENPMGADMAKTSSVFASITHDLGVEVGLAEFRTAHLHAGPERPTNSQTNQPRGLRAAIDFITEGTNLS